MELHELDDLIPGLGIDPTAEQLELLFKWFEEDFVKNPFNIDGCKVKVILSRSKEPGFGSYPETFIHLITRKSANGKRVFDRHRANKIQWVRCILENREEDEISFFTYPESDGSLRDYFWYKEGGFLVIMEKITPDYVIITSFHIDDNHNREYFERKERWYRENGA